MRTLLFNVLYYLLENCGDHLYPEIAIRDTETLTLTP